MAKTPLILSWSGGKDSALTLAALRDDPRYEVVALLTAVTREYDRISIHGVRHALLDAQAAALQLPVQEIPLSPRTTNEEYEAAFLTPYVAAARGYVDEVIEPSATRRQVATALDMLSSKRERIVGRPHHNTPL